MPQTIHQRRRLHLVAQHPSVRAYQQTQRAHYEDQLGALRYEQDRAAEHEARFQAEALLARVRAAGEVGCAEPESLPSLIARLVRWVRTSLRAEFGASWPAWAALYGAYCAAGLWGLWVCVRAMLS